MQTRRQFLATAAGGAAVMIGSSSAALMARARRAGVKFRFGAPDWNLDLEGNPKAVAFAKELGFDGVQFSLTNKTARIGSATTCSISSWRNPSAWVSRSRRCA